MNFLMGNVTAKDIATHKIINRLNMGRLYVFNILATAAMLVITAFLRIFKLFILPESYQTKALLLFTLCLALTAVGIYIIALLKRTDLFEYTCYFFGAVISIVLFNFAFRATTNGAAVVFYWILMLTIALLPILRPEYFAIYWGAHFIPTVILCITRHFASDNIISLLLITIMSVLLSYGTYSFTIRKLELQVSLDKAVNQAETDPMTQLLNNRGLSNRIIDVWPNLSAKHTPVAVYMMDIDNFKKYNDHYGHPQGDECLKKVSSIIQKCIRSRCDYAARVGGEEFLVILTGLSLQDSLKWGLYLRKNIAEANIPHATSPTKPVVTLSLGMAYSVVDDTTTIEALRSTADKALYEAKSNGKNVIYFQHKPFGKGLPSSGSATRVINQ